MKPYNEPIYVKSEYQHIVEKWEEADEAVHENHNLSEFFINHLPDEEDFYGLILQDPEGVLGDWTMYIYKGQYNPAANNE